MPTYRLEKRPKKTKEQIKLEVLRDRIVDLETEVTQLRGTLMKLLKLVEKEFELD